MTSIPVFLVERLDSSINTIQYLKSQETVSAQGKVNLMGINAPRLFNLEM